jgi:tRNA pseudouridine13 synthase
MPGPTIKSSPEDFVVDEIPLYAAIGSGTHTFLRIEKRMRTTEDVVGDLARVFGMKRRDIGYAGRKDRVALTRQWFSVPDLDPERAAGFEVEGAKVLEAIRHQHKLRTGHLKGNRFSIWVRDLSGEEIRAAKDKLESFATAGFPNRFGDQRFGRDGENAKRGLAVLQGKVRPKERKQARFLLSSLQSQVFNHVLASRPLALDQFEVGDLAIKHDSGGSFHVEDVATENVRAQNFEISPTGPIFGTKVSQPLGAPAERERDALMHYGIPAPENLRPPRGISLRGARRALRARPLELRTSVSELSIKLEFSLPSGSYATVLLEEVFGALQIEAGMTRR